ncbi:hypothetical protein PITCH_A1050017 [uncultured Desulfobacterium sp.]|uniref:Uncharacterized protein n=1 Tax=uncultured Desulfobacterium sp. TaxID=201089 RepID=A0A445MQR8_9BACT|nr:hypothetical protein PITCH_A1050017 [uncultured Desulfobacterium sp.]
MRLGPERKTREVKVDILEAGAEAVLTGMGMAAVEADAVRVDMVAAEADAAEGDKSRQAANRVKKNFILSNKGANDR